MFKAAASGFSVKYITCALSLIVCWSSSLSSAEGQTFWVSGSQNNPNLPKRVQLVPPLRPGLAPSKSIHPPQPKTIVIKDKEGKFIDDLLFGFLTADGRPMKDKQVLSRAEKVMAEIWFGKIPDSVFLTNSNSLAFLAEDGSFIETKVVLAYEKKGKRQLFEEKEEEPFVLKQLYSQMRDVFYPPQYHAFQTESKEPLYFGFVSRKPFDSQLEEQLLNGVGQILSGNDDETVLVDSFGLVGVKDQGVRVEFFVAQSPPNGEFVKLKKMDAREEMELRVRARQHLLQVAYVDRAVAVQKRALIAEVEGKISSLRGIVSAPATYEKNSRIKALENALNQIPVHLNSVKQIADSNIREKLNKEIAELEKSTFAQLDRLKYPFVFPSVGSCPRYALEETKRDVFGLKFDGTQVLNLKARPDWYQCWNDVFLIVHDKEIRVVNNGEESVYESLEALKRDGAKWIDTGIDQFVQLSVDSTSSFVIEIDVAQKKLFQRFQLRNDLAELFAIRKETAGSFQVSIKKDGKNEVVASFQSLDFKSMVEGDSNFVIVVQRAPESPPETILVTQNGVSFLSEVLPKEAGKLVKFDTSDKSWQFFDAPDSSTFYRLDAAGRNVVKQLMAPAACVANYDFRFSNLNGEEAVDVSFTKAPEKKLLSVHGLGELNCFDGTLFFIAVRLGDVAPEVSEHEGAMHPMQIEPPMAKEGALYILNSSGILSAFQAPPSFKWSGLKVNEGAKEVTVGLSGPASILVTLSVDGDWKSPVIYGEPMTDSGLIGQVGAPAAWFEKGKAVVVTPKLIGFARKEGRTVIAYQKVDEANAPDKPVTLANYFQNELQWEWQAPLVLEGEDIESIRLVAKDRETQVEVWISNNSDYRLLLNLSSKIVTALPFITAPENKISWEEK